MPKVIEVEGIGKKYAQLLKGINLRTTGALLKAGATRKGRKEIADKIKVSEKLVLEWVNRVDLFRIKGVGEQYSDLLEFAGVDSVPELSKRRADNLHEKMVETNASKKLVRQLPSEKMIAGWIDQAKSLPKVVSH